VIPPGTCPSSAAPGSATAPKVIGPGSSVTRVSATP